MPACPVCTAHNPDAFRFCGECGHQLAVLACTSCGDPYQTGQRFCGRCGSPVGEAVMLQQDPEGSRQERKLATVLFADVVGFTSLSERTDPEVVARMVDGAFREMAAVVVAHGGTIDKYMGDSLMAVFGVPTAHDDDAERAVAAALAMCQLDGDLEFSIGINSGEVMVTPIADDGGVTVIGDTVNVAARLEKAAGAGEVLCGALTAELVGRRGVFRARQPVVLKGKQEPVVVFESVGLRPVGTDPAVDDVPLVGRTDEMSYLRAVWQRVARDDQFHLVVLCGEPGSGKTRLAGELTTLAAADGTIVQAAYPAYGPLGGVTVISDVLRQVGLVDNEAIIARVRSLAGMTDSALKSMDPAALQKEQLWGLVRLLEQKAAERPLLIVIDDAHRSSERMLHLLDELVKRLDHVPILMILAGRSDPGSWLGHFSAATTLRLGPLSGAEAASLAEALACDQPLGEAAVRFLVDRSGGNPLYLRELLRVAQASGSLTFDGEKYQLGAAAALPASLHAVLSARLDSLGSAQKAVFQHLAVLGSGANQEAVEKLLADGGSVVAAAGALQALVEAGVIRYVHDRAIEPVDPLLAEVAYETLPRHVRAHLHQRAAAQAAGPEDKARHLERAVEFHEDDVDLSREAAEVLAALGQDYEREARYPEALRLMERAVALGCRQPAVLLQLADLQGMAGDGEGALASLGLIPDDPGDRVLMAERDHAAARTRLFLDPAAALPVLQEVAQRWHELGRPVDEAWALGNAGVASFNLNQVREAADHLERAYEKFVELGDRGGAVSTSSFLCLVKPSDSRVPEWLAEGLAFADETGDRDKQVGALSLLTWNHFVRAMWGGSNQAAGVEQFGRRLADTAAQLGADEMEMQGRSLLALIYRWSGRLGQAADQQALLARILDRSGQHAAWIAWASGFVVEVAGGNTTAVPPFPPLELTESVAGVAGVVLRSELLFAGRIEEALARTEAQAQYVGTISDAVGVVDAMTYVLAGRTEEAVVAARRAARAGEELDARPVQAIAGALLAEAAGDQSNLETLPESVDSVADAFLARAHALGGNPKAPALLARAARDLALPGLLLRV